MIIFSDTRDHGRRKDFFQGGQYGIFPKFFPGVTKSGEIWFLPFEIEKTTFFANNFKIQGGQSPPSDAHARDPIFNSRDPNRIPETP